jgi:hypothetical protein
LVYLALGRDTSRRAGTTFLSNPTIKQILHNQRKLAYIKKIRKDLLSDAIESNEFKINPWLDECHGFRFRESDDAFKQHHNLPASQKKKKKDGAIKQSP